MGFMNSLWLFVGVLTVRSVSVMSWVLRTCSPGGSKYMWTAQLDVDIPLGR
jgi:hypothetical protein